MFTKRPRAELFIGITSWNSAYFLGHCLDAALRTTKEVDTRILVLDNTSTDSSPVIAKDRGVELLSRACSQGDALNELLRRANSRYILLMHADVILLSPLWYDHCCAKLDAQVALVSPEDIGCGPLTRPFGKDKPESSFMFFRTDNLARIKMLKRQRLGPLPFPRRQVDFYGPHVTHHLPEHLAAKGYSWHPMRVHYSEALAEPVYPPPASPGVWTDELRYLLYGLGNFYSLDGVITHYHNWYDRVQQTVTSDVPVKQNTGFPLDYIKSYSARFLQDYLAGQLRLPDTAPSGREPRAL